MRMKSGMSENKRHYEYSELEEQNNKAPLWLIALYVGIASIFVIYLVKYLY